MSSPIQMDRKQFQKMVFITNALEDGWTVKKLQDSYIFTKKHENRREIFQENYLESFLREDLRFPPTPPPQWWIHSSL